MYVSIYVYVHVCNVRNVCMCLHYMPFQTLLKRILSRGFIQLKASGFGGKDGLASKRCQIAGLVNHGSMSHDRYTRVGEETNKHSKMSLCCAHAGYCMPVTQTKRSLK